MFLQQFGLPPSPVLDEVWAAEQEGNLRESVLSMLEEFAAVTRRQLSDFRPVLQQLRRKDKRRLTAN